VCGVKRNQGEKGESYYYCGRRKIRPLKEHRKKLKLVRERLITKRRQRFFGVLCAKKE
jgi:hypothetical protein